MDQLLKKKIKDKLNSLPNIQFATVFGSYAKNCNRPGSDLDIAIAAYEVITDKQMLEIRVQLTIALDKDIDLIDLNTVNGLILCEALCEGEVILKKDTLLYAELIKKLIYDQTDTMRYYNNILRQRRENYFYA